MKDPLMVIPFIFVGFLIGFMIIPSPFMREIVKLEKENTDREQAERTKRTAERNGVGG